MVLTDLLDLPDEILLQIASYSTYTSRITQSLTCKRLYSIINDGKVSQVDCVSRYLDLLLLEWLFPLLRRYACAHCIRLLPRSAFLISQTRDRPKARRSVQYLLQLEENGQNDIRLRDLRDELHLKCLFNIRGSVDTTEWENQQLHLGHAPLTPLKLGKVPQKERICIECGVKASRWSSDFVLKYPLDDEATIMGTGIICKRCDKFTACAQDSKTMLTRRCKPCQEYRPHALLRSAAWRTGTRT